MRARIPPEAVEAERRGCRGVRRRRTAPLPFSSAAARRSSPPIPRAPPRRARPPSAHPAAPTHRCNAAAARSASAARDRPHTHVAEALLQYGSSPPARPPTECGRPCQHRSRALPPACLPLSTNRLVSTSCDTSAQRRARVGGVSERCSTSSAASVTPSKRTLPLSVWRWPIGSQSSLTVIPARSVGTRRTRCGRCPDRARTPSCCEPRVPEQKPFTPSSR